MTDIPVSTPIGAKVFRRSPLSRLSSGHLVMIAAGLLALLLNVFLIRSRGETMEVLVASRAIPAGSRIGPDDLLSASVDANGPFVDRVLTDETIDPLLGHVVVRAIAAGAPLISGDLRPPASAGGGRAMSIPVSPDHAVGGALYVGDRVDVIAVQEGGSRFVATAIEVLEVSSGSSRLSGGGFGVVVAVSAAEALAISGALDGGAVHLIRSTGTDPVDYEVPPTYPAARPGETAP